jgi:hypothetical protein
MYIKQTIFDFAVQLAEQYKSTPITSYIPPMKISFTYKDKSYSIPCIPNYLPFCNEEGEEKDYVQFKNNTNIVINDILKTIYKLNITQFNIQILSNDGKLYTYKITQDNRIVIENTSDQIEDPQLIKRFDDQKEVYNMIELNDKKNIFLLLQHYPHLLFEGGIPSDEDKKQLLQSNIVNVQKVVEKFNNMFSKSQPSSLITNFNTKFSNALNFLTRSFQERSAGEIDLNKKSL